MSHAGSFLSLHTYLQEYKQAVFAQGYEVYWGGTLLTEENLVTLHDKIHVKNTRAGVRAVDMESFYIVEFLLNRGIKVAIIRSVSDSLHFDLPNEKFIIENMGTINPLRWCIQILCHPHETIKLIRLTTHVKKAIKSNIYFLLKVIEQIL